MKPSLTLAIALLAIPTLSQETPANRLVVLDMVSDALANVDSDLDLFVNAATAANQSQTLAAFADLADGTTSNSAEIQAGYETVENYGSRVRIALARAARTARDGGLEGVAQQLTRGMSCLELRDIADSDTALIRQKDLTSITKGGVCTGQVSLSSSNPSRAIHVHTEERTQDHGRCGDSISGCGSNRQAA